MTRPRSSPGASSWSSAEAVVENRMRVSPVMNSRTAEPKTERDRAKSTSAAANARPEVMVISPLRCGLWTASKAARPTSVPAPGRGVQQAHSGHAQPQEIPGKDRHQLRVRATEQADDARHKHQRQDGRCAANVAQAFEESLARGAKWFDRTPGAHKCKRDDDGAETGRNQIEHTADTDKRQRRGREGWSDE